MKKVAVIGSESFIRFFELIGAEGFMAETSNEIKNKVKEIVESKEYSVVIIPERFLDVVKPIKDKLIREEKIEPIFVFLPDFIEITEKRIEELKRNIMQAIGIEIRM